MNRKEIESEYKVVDGIIRSPGKFEGEPVYAVYFWDMVMNGMSDGSEDGNDTLDWFDVTTEDVAEFPSLAGIKRLSIWCDDSGFVHTETV